VLTSTTDEDLTDHGQPDDSERPTYRLLGQGEDEPADRPEGGQARRQVAADQQQRPPVTAGRLGEAAAGVARPGLLSAYYRGRSGLLV